MPTPRISVLIVDDHSVFREGLRTLLRNEKDITIAGEATSGMEALRLVRKCSPTLVIMDLAMPILNGFEAMRRILEIKPDVKFVVLSAYSDEKYVERCIAIGATGFIAKENSYLVVLDAIREVAKGRSYFCPLVKGFVNSLKQKKTAPKEKTKKACTKGLTGRELQVLRLVAEGASNKQVAATLEISIKTVEKHRQQLMDKLDIHDTAGLTRYAIAAGVLESIDISLESLD
ncbi:MAG: response regulator transcription factor [Opitutaceae bacterium]|jgi:DNA-binding NarL/FixJ family response regulator